MPNSTRSVRILLTAAEAFPAMENAFLGAKSEIWASFVVFDLTTRLRSPEAQAIGKTWFDLIVHTLNRGVAVHMVIPDADPVARAMMHRAATRQLRMFAAAAAVAEPGAVMDVQRLRHPAETGVLVRLMAWPHGIHRIIRLSRWLNGLASDHRAAALRDMDGTSHCLKTRADGTVGSRFWSWPRVFPAAHHQKLAVIDRRLLFIGGVDLEALHDEPPPFQNAANPTLHDVQLMIEGPVVAEAQQHLETFRDVVAGRVAPPTTRRLLRTLSRPRRGSFWHFGPEPVITEVQTAHIVLTRRSTRFIYIEAPCFRDLGLARALADTARMAPGLQMILILPAIPDGRSPDALFGTGTYLRGMVQAGALRILRRAFGSRLFVGSPALPRPAQGSGADTGYGKGSGMAQASVPASVSVFDDASGIVSSAGLDGQSLRRDTEAGVYLTNANDVTELRHRVMARWLPDGSASGVFDPDTAVGALTQIAWRNAAKSGFERAGCLVPHDFAAADALGRKLPPPPPDFA